MYPLQKQFDHSRSDYKPLLLDGAMGSLLHRRGVQPDPILWTSYANIFSSELVRQIHSEYLRAGADIITTNTFRTNPAAVAGSNYSSEQLVFSAVKLAKEAAAEKPGTLIAGSNAPAEDCYQAERTLSADGLHSNHHEHIDHLMNAGCSFILNETQSHLDEIGIICRYCDINKIPFVISLFFTPEMKLLSGEDILEAIELVKSFYPLAVSFNCIHPQVFEYLLLRYKPDYNWGFYLNLGTGNYTDEQITCSIDELSYLQYIRKYFSYKPSFIGGCCGSAPSHIKKLREYIDGLY